MTCKFCLKVVEMDEHAAHCLGCRRAQEEGTSFAHRNYLREHQRQKHPRSVEQYQRKFDDCCFEDVSLWPRICGFCYQYHLTWGMRVDHVKAYFEHGSRIEKWKNMEGLLRDID